MPHQRTDPPTILGHIQKHPLRMFQTAASHIQPRGGATKSNIKLIDRAHHWGGLMIRYLFLLPSQQVHGDGAGELCSPPSLMTTSSPPPNTHR